MESLTNDAQWIVLLGFLMSIGLISAAILTPAPLCPDPRAVSVIGSNILISDVRDCVIKIAKQGDSSLLHSDISSVMLAETHASVGYELKTQNRSLSFSFQNGIVNYEENRKI